MPGMPRATKKGAAMAGADGDEAPEPGEAENLQYGPALDHALAEGKEEVRPVGEGVEEADRRVGGSEAQGVEGYEAPGEEDEGGGIEAVEGEEGPASALERRRRERDHFVSIDGGRPM